MSKVFLISSNTAVDPYPVYPLGMALVASALQTGGHQVFQFDLLAGDRPEVRLKKSLLEFSPDFVGISLRNIDNVDSLTSDNHWYLEEAKRLIEKIKNFADAPIIVGGPAFSIMPEDILDYIRADFGVVGEGERAFCELLETFAKGHFPPRIINAKGAFLSGMAMVTPCLVEEIIRFYLQRSGMVGMQTKRGCPHNCLYCTYPGLEGNQLRTRRPEAVVDDIERMKRVYGINTIFFTDSVFNDASGHYLKVAEVLMDRKLGISWSAFFRPKNLGRGELKLLKASGLYAVEAGSDAACDVTLGALNKRFSAADVIEFNRICLKEEIPCAHFMMFGGPDETETTLKEGLDNLTKLDNCIVFAFSGIRILPGTGLHARAVCEGVLTAKDSLLKPVYYFSPKIDPAKMNERIESAFHGRRDRIFPPSEGQIRMAAMNRFGYRGLMWDKLIHFANQRPLAELGI
jgi:lipid biosynthesis B12-binding/radical SAM protein